MGVAKIPISEKDVAIKRYLAGDIDYLVERYGFKNRTSLQHTMAQRFGVKVSEQPATLEPMGEPEIIVKTPKIKIKEYKARHQGKGDPETQVLLLGDHHAGEITPTYNSKVYKKRLENTYQYALNITELHRHMYPIDDLVIILLGDMVHGENPRQGARLGATECGAVDQVYDLAFPELLSLIVSMRESFKSVKVYGVQGNHGRISREAPETSNWDNMLYKALSKANLPSGVTVTPPTDFCQMVDINGFNFFCYHGDQIQMSNGIPYFSQARHVKDWYFTYGGFPYAIQGHFHKDDYLRISAKTKLFANGSLVSDDPYALARIGTSTIPNQWTFGVHNRRGVSWTYPLTVDDAFLPERRDK